MFPEAPMVLLDSGNFSDNPTPDGDKKTKALLKAMEQLGYSVVNFGERDIRMGYDELIERTKDSKLKFISANIVRQDTQEAIFEPHAVVEVRGANKKKIRIGVIISSFMNIFMAIPAKDLVHRTRPAGRDWSPISLTSGGVDGPADWRFVYRYQ